MIKDSVKQLLTPYRQIRFLSNQNTALRRSNCQLTELEVFGVRYYSETVDVTANKVCDITLKSHSFSATLASSVAQITYSPA